MKVLLVLLVSLGTLCHASRPFFKKSGATRAALVRRTPPPANSFRKLLQDRRGHTAQEIQQQAIPKDITFAEKVSFFVNENKHGILFFNGTFYGVILGVMLGVLFGMQFTTTAVLGSTMRTSFR